MRSRGRGAAIAAALVLLLLLLPAAAAAQASGEEMEPKRYDESGRPLREGRAEACRRRAEARHAACLNRALRRTDLNSGDTSFYRRCAEESRTALARCTAGEGPP